MRSKRIMIGAAVLLLLIGIGQMNDAVAQAIRQVLVVNPPSIPLHTVIQNVPNVNLSPTSNVGIAEGRNTVQVASSATSPLWSLDLDAPQRQQPYNFSFGAPIPAFQSAGDATVAIVQNGQHFVIRHVSVSAAVPIGAKAQARIFAFVNGELIWEHPLVLTAQGDFTVPHTETFVGSQPMEIHVRGVSAGDTEIVMRVLRDGVANDTPAGFVASISGYFVN